MVLSLISPPMKTCRTGSACVVLLLAALSFGSGCGRGAKETGDTSNTPGKKEEKKQEEPLPRLAVFNPKRAPASIVPFSKELDTAFNDAAKDAEAFQHAMPYERVRILSAVSKKLSAASALYSTEAKTHPTTNDLSLLVEVDPRFASLCEHPEVAEAISLKSAPASPSGKQNIDDFRADSRDGGSTTSDDRDAVSVKTLRPQSFVTIISETGNLIGNATTAAAAESELTKRTAELVKAIEEKGEISDSTFAFAPNESPNARAAKLGVKALYDDLLGSLVSYKGGFFVGATRPSGALQIWEFKEPFQIIAERHEPGEEEKLNSGVEFSAIFSLTSEGEENFKRVYENGYWGPWEKTQPFKAAELTKNKNWKIEHFPHFETTGFRTLTAPQIEAALSRSDTTQDFGQAIAGGAKGDASQEIVLIRTYCAENKESEAAATCEQFLNAGPSVQELKEAIASLSEMFYRLDPTAGGDFYRGRFFDYYKNYPNISSMTPDYKALGVPLAGTPTHAYGVVPTKALAALTSVYKKLCDAEPENADTRFDIGLLYLLTGFSSRSYSNDPNVYLGRAALSFKDSLVKAKNNPPASSRDYAYIIRATPTCVPIHNCNDSEIGRFWNDAIKEAGSSDSYFFQQFAKAINYESAGY
jgi:hypothetical protein